MKTKLKQIADELIAELPLLSVNQKEQVSLAIEQAALTGERNILKQGEEVCLDSMRKTGEF